LLAQNRTGINIALLPPPTEKRRSLCPSANLLEASSSATGPADPPRRSTALLRPSPDGDAAGIARRLPSDVLARWTGIETGIYVYTVHCTILAG